MDEKSEVKDCSAVSTGRDSGGGTASVSWEILGDETETTREGCTKRLSGDDISRHSPHLGQEGGPVRTIIYALPILNQAEHECKCCRAQTAYEFGSWGPLRGIPDGQCRGHKVVNGVAAMCTVASVLLILLILGIGLCIAGSTKIEP